MVLEHASTHSLWEKESPTFSLGTESRFVPQEAPAGVQMHCNSQPLKPGKTGTAPVNLFFSCVYLLLPVSHLLDLPSITSTSNSSH